jgi:hypothetical protein
MVIACVNNAGNKGINQMIVAPRNRKDTCPQGTYTDVWREVEEVS